MPRRRPRRERRKKQLGELIHFETNKQYIMVTPKEFAKIVGNKPGGLVTYIKNNNYVFRVGNDKEIIVKHMGQKAVVFEERRVQPGGSPAEVMRLKPLRQGRAVPEKPKDVKKMLHSKGMPENVANKIVDSLQASGEKKSKKS